MDMDAPLPDELEWLESNAYPPSEDDDPTPFDESPSRTPKRPRPDDPEVFVEERSSEKRGRREEEEEEEEEWLRYSPRKDGDGDGERVEEVVVVEERFVSRFASEIDGDCVPVTGPDGDRVYVKVETSAVHKGGDGSRMERPAKGLLFEPIDLLMKRVEDEALQKALQESFEPSSYPVDPVAPKASGQLWVEKYAPNSFTELLSDELTNREVLHWLKQWDSCVFGLQIRATTDDVLSSLKRHTSIAQGQHRTISNTSYFGKTKGSPFNTGRVNRLKFLQKENDTSEETSESFSKSQQSLGPPEHKVLLLCGPPGLGKTTLAHVAAKHCGYRVVEINASDERSSSAVESKILDVVQMNSVMADSKPKCLVIDEIDGALGEGKGVVDVILKMVNAEKKYSQGNNNLAGEGGKPSSRKGHKTAKLSRPVICICNDLYAPALRPLRQIAKVHVFMQPSVSRVVNRLKYICKMENFRTSSIALSALAGYTECDIRSCLNTLQFLHKKNENLNFLEIDSQVVGRKDLSKSAFDVWKEVFQKRKVKREKSRNASSISGDFEFMYSLLSNRGEYELTMDGIYENFLRMSYHDPVMRKTSGCLDVLGVSDSLLRYTMQNQKMSLNVYQPFVAITMKNLIAQVERPNIEWPKSIQRCRMTLMEKNELLKIWQGRIIPSMSRHMSPKSFVEDIVSPLLHILSPPTLRPVALHLLSEKEKEDLFQLVDTMVSYSITYKNSKLEHTTKTNKYGAASDVPLFTLDPQIDDLIGFKDHQPEHHRLPLATKQILVHEVEKHRILCESTRKSLDQNKDGKKHRSTCTGTTTAVDKNTNLPENKMITSSVTRSFPATGIKSKAPLQPKKSMGRPTSFFDRFRVKGSKGSESSDDVFQPATMERDSRPLLFKYNEGFTNAVKRPVRVRELLL